MPGKLTTLKTLFEQNKFQILLIVAALAVGFVSYQAERGKNAPAPEAAVLAGARETAAAPAASSAPARSGCIEIGDAGNFVGETKCVSGILVQAYTSKKGTTFLDFCKSYRTCPFTAVIFASAREKFGDLKALEGKRITVTGFVKTYKGQPEIVIDDPAQIQVQR